MYLVTNAAHFEQNLVGALVEQRAAERANHVLQLLISAVRVSTKCISICGNARTSKHAARTFFLHGFVNERFELDAGERDAFGFVA